MGGGESQQHKIGFFNPLDQSIQTMNFNQFLMKAKYASCSILLLALNKISCYFQSRLYLNVELCSIYKQSQEAVNSHASDSLAYKIDINMTVQTQLLSIHSKIYSSKQQGF